MRKGRNGVLCETFAPSAVKGFYYPLPILLMTPTANGA